MNYFSSSKIACIHSVEHYRQSIYSDLDPNKTVDFFVRKYVKPISKRVNITKTVMADGGAGYGWLSLAFLFSGGKQAILIEPDEKRLAAAKKITKIAGVSERCDFLCRKIQENGLGTDEVDLFAAVEVLEHIGKNNVKHAIRGIARAARSCVIITTPNRIFPIVAHDTRLPFAHWMPQNLRTTYARLFNRESLDDGNYFLSPCDLLSLSKKFQPDTKIGTFSSVEEFRAFYPHYLPYGRNPSKRIRKKPNPFLEFYLHMASVILQYRAYWIAPNMASIWIRRTCEH
ncbi:MAG: class I SAM-dependent methyltransferase [Deltaproteobacteria bacterium]|jgi:2-polyprenyl-3-methyl-5-hydroxy-6-metoxy-1,4-benzoquinol methylase|nr:class I SAM-dependent methyltransferase [Deltaproteobacteria bacterium]